MAGLFGDTTTTTTTNPILAPGQEGINTAALDIFNQGPLPYYPGQTIAPRDPFQNQAQAGLNNFLTGPGGQSSYTPWYGADDPYQSDAFPEPGPIPDWYTGNMMDDVPGGSPGSGWTNIPNYTTTPYDSMNGPSQIMGPGGTTPEWVNQINQNTQAPSGMNSMLAQTMGTVVPDQTAQQEQYIKGLYDQYGWGDNYAPGSSWMQDFGSGQSESDIANSFATIAAQQQQDSPYTAQTGMMNQGISAALDRGNIRDVGEYNEQNPYLAQMAQGALTQMGNNFNRNILPGIRGGEISAGQYGGTRGDIAQGLAASDFGQQAANMLGGLYGTAYESERGRNLQSQIANQSADISAGNLGISAASMVPALTNQSLGQFSLLDQMGMANRADNQNLINADIDRYNYTQNAPYDALQRYASIINQGNPAGQTRTETIDDSGISLSGLLGGSAVGYKIGKGLNYPWMGTIGGGLLGAFNIMGLLEQALQRNAQQQAAQQQMRKMLQAQAGSGQRPSLTDVVRGGLTGQGTIAATEGLLSPGDFMNAAQASGNSPGLFGGNLAADAVANMYGFNSGIGKTVGNVAGTMLGGPIGGVAGGLLGRAAVDYGMDAFDKRPNERPRDFLEANAQGFGSALGLPGRASFTELGNMFSPYGTGWQNIQPRGLTPAQIGEFNSVVDANPYRSMEAYNIPAWGGTNEPTTQQQSYNDALSEALGLDPVTGFPIEGRTDANLAARVDAALADFFSGIDNTDPVTGLATGFTNLARSSRGGADTGGSGPSTSGSSQD